MAYGKIYRNKGAMTHGVTDETPAGMSLEKIDAIIKALRDEQYQWLPARRTYIPKKNGKKRPLGMPMVRSYCPPYGKLSGLSCSVDRLIRSTLVLL
jgi:retron-type reverse transcriptase